MEHKVYIGGHQFNYEFRILNYKLGWLDNPAAEEVECSSAFKQVL